MTTEVPPADRRTIEDAITFHAAMIASGMPEARQGALDTILAIAAPLLAAPRGGREAQRDAGEQRRVAELAELAASILASYIKTGDGYRGRAGQVQIARWQATLDSLR